jgi:hypothetical protein
MHIHTGAKHVIDDQQTIVRIEVFQQVLGAVNSNLSVRVVDCLVIGAQALIGGSYGNVIGFDAKCLQTLLDVDSNGTAPSP